MSRSEKRPTKYGTGICTICNKEYSLRVNMVIKGHPGIYGVNCQGSNKKPKKSK